MYQSCHSYSKLECQYRKSETIEIKLFESIINESNQTQDLYTKMNTFALHNILTSKI